MELVKVVERVGETYSLDKNEKAAALSLLKIVGKREEPIGSFSRIEHGNVWHDCYGIVLHSGMYKFTKLPSVNKWVLMGVYYGYPKCCIEYFISNKPGGKPMTGTGYVMCPACAKRDKKQLINEINANRFSKSIFPDVRYDEETLAICYFAATHDFSEFIKGVSDV